jgi:surfeit locus 1 family protein
MAVGSLQFNFRNQTYLFKFRLVFTLLCLSLFILCCFLGVWQLHRYAHKKALITEYQARLTAPAKPFKEIAEEPNLQFQRVYLSGEYLNEQTMLVQNRFYHDQLGFEVLTPLRIFGEKKLVLIDRGWVQKPPQAALPKIQSVNGKQDIQGYIKLLDEYQFILGENILLPNNKPLVLQRIDMNDIRRVTEQPFYPFILRLDAGQSHGFVRDWTIATVTPERHMGYAIQWFALALVLLIAYLCFCCERKEI